MTLLCGWTSRFKEKGWNWVLVLSRNFLIYSTTLNSILYLPEVVKSEFRDLKLRIMLKGYYPCNWALVKLNFYP